MNKHAFPIIMILLLVILLASCTGNQFGSLATQTGVPPTATAPLKEYKLAAIFSGVVTDADFTTLGYLAINQVQRELNLETTYVEQVGVAMADETIRGFIADGYNIIWTHGGQYIDIAIDLARHFPDIVFIAEGDEPVVDQPANLWFIDRNFQMGFYLIGATAALSTRTGKIGYLGGERLPYSYTEFHAIEQAIRDLGMDDSVELKSVWVGDFNDTLKARELTNSLITEGVDFIIVSLNLGTYGVFEAVKDTTERKVLITGRFIDKSAFAPDHYVTSLLYDFSTPLKKIIQKVMPGESGGYYPLGFTVGVSLQLPFRNVDPSVERQVSRLLDQIINGTITIEKDSSPIE